MVNNETEKSIREKLELKEPPLTWFYGAGRRAKGISVITFSEELEGLENGQVGKHMMAWSHYEGNPVHEDDPPERKERALKTLAEAQVFVTRITGFTPREIMDKMSQLLKEYRGKDNAPFSFELF